MTANEGVRGRVTIELMLAGGIMILSAASIAALALATTAGSALTLTPSSAVPLAFALVLAASGVEAVRRRHFLFAVLVPAALALMNLGYVIGTGQAVALPSVAIFVLVVILVYSQRSAFRD
jgi:hypothetical protein